jgi:hypothetical protein
LAYDSTATLDTTHKTGKDQYAGHTIERKADGTIEVAGPSVTMKPRIPQAGDFDENLAEVMHRHDRKLLAMRLKEFAEVDKDSRRDWEERERRAMEMLGIKDIPRDDEDLEGGHDVTHPALMEATSRFQANAIVELFPPEGPLETKILGLDNAQKMARAKRIRTFGNHYLVDVDKGYFTDTDKMLMYLPMGGSVFRRASQDFTTGLPILRHVKATNFLAPYAGTDLESMPRYAWKFTSTGDDIDRAMRIGMFVDLYLPAPSPPMPGQAMHAIAADQSDMRVANLHERDRLYDMLEYHIDLELDCDPKGAGAIHLKEGDLGMRPYIVVVDASNEEILMVRRNWGKQDKEQFKKRIWFAHHQFLPGLGFYGWGYPHVIGSIGNAASGAVNSLLDSALAANFQGGFVTKEAKVAGEFRLEHGLWKQVDSTAEDLAKSFYTPPFKEPSPALFQLLGDLVGAVQRFSGTTDAAVGDGSNMGPVGTTMALIEQAQKPQNAIHKRLHVSMSQELQMFAQLVEDFMPEKYDYQIGEDQQYLLKSDFAPGVDVICVTDPAISSDTMRVMRAQAVIDLQTKDPSLYPPPKRAEAHRRMLVALKVPNIEAIAPQVQTPKYLDPVAENANIFAGTPVKVFPTQDDQAHITVHTDGLQRAQNLYPLQVFQTIIQPAMQAHIRDHMAKAYYKQVMSAAGLPVHFDQDGNPQTENPQPPPKPQTPGQAEQEGQLKLKLMQDQSTATLDQNEQKFQAEERRKQLAFDNEERRKDQAMNFQETRESIAGATAMVRGHQEQQVDNLHKGNKHVQDIVHTEQKHHQALVHGADQHAQALDQGDEQHGQKLEHGQESHEQGMDQGEEQHEQGLEQGQEQHEQGLEQGAESHGQDLEQGAESHAQGLDQSDQQHSQALQQGDEVAKAAAAEEAESDSHQGGSVK